MNTKTTVERAFELARTGAFKAPSDITRMLSKEGYSAPNAYLSGAGIRKQLTHVIAEARRRHV